MLFFKPEMSLLKPGMGPFRPRMCPLGPRMVPFRHEIGPFMPGTGPLSLTKSFSFFLIIGPFEKIVGQIRLVFHFGWGYLRVSGSLPPPPINENSATASASMHAFP